jgi:hypothetical protein
MITVKRKKLSKEKTNANYLAMLNKIYHSNFINGAELCKQFSVTHQCIKSLSDLQFITWIGKGTYKWNLQDAPSIKHVLAMKRENIARNKSHVNKQKQLAINFTQRKKASNPRIAPAQHETTNNIFAYLFVFLLGAVVTAVCWYAAQK